MAPPALGASHPDPRLKRPSDRMGCDTKVPRRNRRAACSSKQRTSMISPNATEVDDGPTHWLMVDKRPGEHLVDRHHLRA